MLFVDVNVLVYAHRTDAARHSEYATWLDAAAYGDEPVALTDGVLASVIRIVTHPRIFQDPSPIVAALEFVDVLRTAPATLRCDPGGGTWSTFVDLVERTEARGNAIPDALLAAQAIDLGSTLVTADRGFAKYPRLRWKHPLD